MPRFAKGAPIKIASGSFTGASDLFFYVKSDSPINTFKDMNGKSIGFSRPGSSTYVAEHVLATQIGVTPNYVSTGEMAATLTQVMSGQVDAGWAVVPVNLDLVAKKQIKIIARGSEAKALSAQAVRVNIVNTKWVDAHRDAYARFWKGYSDTIDWMYKNQSAAIANFASTTACRSMMRKRSCSSTRRARCRCTRSPASSGSIEDAVTYKFISAPLTADQQKAIFRHGFREEVKRFAPPAAIVLIVAVALLEGAARAGTDAGDGVFPRRARLRPVSATSRATEISSCRR